MVWIIITANIDIASGLGKSIML